jgi:hypothetical protein
MSERQLTKAKFNGRQRHGIRTAGKVVLARLKVSTRGGTKGEKKERA